MQTHRYARVRRPARTAAERCAHRSASGCAHRSASRCAGRAVHRSDAPQSRGAALAGLFAVCTLVFAAGMILARPAEFAPSVIASGRAQDELVLSIDIDMTSDPGDELVTSRKISSSEGSIELYAASDGGGRGTEAQASKNAVNSPSSMAQMGKGGYRRLAQVDAGPVVEMAPVILAAPGSDGAARPVWGSLILAHAEYDQTMGAMSKSRVSTAYAWNGVNLAEVWSAATASESVWNTSWGQPSADAMSSWAWRRVRGETPLAQPGAAIGASGSGGDGKADSSARLGPGNWVRLAGSCRVEFVKGSVPVVVLRSFQEYQSYSEKTDSFSTIRSRNVTAAYCWSDRWGSFIRSEGSIGSAGTTGMDYPGAGGGFRIPPGAEAAILELERECPEGLAFPAPYLARIKLRDGRRCFVREDDILASAVHSMV
ncbi:MAG: hypothetical protein VB144_08185 [Clostridia bacterium]|nr:hypothetical protein [Clostridia bacterium]